MRRLSRCLLSVIPFAFSLGGVDEVDTISQMAAPFQRLNRRSIVFHLPYFSGTSRQGAP